MLDTSIARPAADTQRKSAAPDDATPSAPVTEAGNGAVTLRSFALARQLLRDPGTRQAGFKAELMERFPGMIRKPVLFQEGEAHQKQRHDTARFFAPKVVRTRYRDLITELAATMAWRIRSAGRASLDDLAFEMAVAVAGEIVGLTNSPRAAMAKRLNRFFSIGGRRDAGFVSSAIDFVKGQLYLAALYRADVRPAIRSRRVRRRDDVISHLIGQGYRNRDILVECLTYGAAGMATTREFIVMAAWHLFEDGALRMRFLDGDEAGRITILEEILRLEPVVGRLYRRANQAVAVGDESRPVEIAEGCQVTVDIRAANTDAAAVGSCPFHIDPERNPADRRAAGAALSFGDGPHRCPGGSVAMLESAIFLDTLLRLPGIRLETPPRVGRNDLIAGYELRGAIVTATRG